MLNLKNKIQIVRIVHRSIIFNPIIVFQFLNGDDCGVFCYGQTGSGKTHTMFGPDSIMGNTNKTLSDTGTMNPFRFTTGRLLLSDHEFETECVQVQHGGKGKGLKPLVQHGDKTDWGLVPLALYYILSQIRSPIRESPTPTMESSPMTTIERTTRIRERRCLELRASYLEIFGNQVRDLLTGEIVSSMVTTPPTEINLKGIEDVKKLLEEGEKHKRAAATAMNLRSTRAHAVVMVKLVKRGATNSDEIISRLVLLDLGGSEKLVRSRAHDLVKAPGGIVSGEGVWTIGAF